MLIAIVVNRKVAADTTNTHGYPKLSISEEVAWDLPSSPLRSCRKWVYNHCRWVLHSSVRLMAMKPFYAYDEGILTLIYPYCWSVLVKDVVIEGMKFSEPRYTQMSLLNWKGIHMDIELEIVDLSLQIVVNIDEVFRAMKEKKTYFEKKSIHDFCVSQKVILPPFQIKGRWFSTTWFSTKLY